MLRLNDNKRYLYQWDINQRIIVAAPDGTQVHFSNCRDAEALVVQSFEDDGIVYASIPNILLQSSGVIKAYIYLKDGDEGHTEYEYTFRVLERKKPTDYVYTETEVYTYKVLEEKIDSISQKKADITNGTVISGNADFAEIGEWADGNGSGEDRIGYFVSVDTSSAGTTMVKSTAAADVRGVTVSYPAFCGGASEDKFDDDGNLRPRYSFVAVIGLVSVIDNGLCTINGRCMPADDGTAAPSSNNLGYQVIDRIDETHILISFEPGADMIQRIKNDIGEKLDKTELPSAINAALEQAKESGEFDGKDGAPGRDGIDGKNGQDGSPGKDGTSATHSWNGTVLTMTSASGTSSADLKGDKGDKGDKGEQGDKGIPGPAGSDANVTAENIESALGYTPANEERVNQLKQDIAGKITAPASASIGQTIRVKTVDETGHPTEWEAVDASSGGVQFTTDETLSLKDGILSVNTAQEPEPDNTLPITSAAVHTTVGNIGILLQTI